VLTATQAEPPVTHKQLFWVSFGQNWCDKERDPSIKMAIAVSYLNPKP
jgi:hypothetical protein